MTSKAEAEIMKMKELEARIKAPSIWGRLPCGIRIEDLQDKRYEEAVKLLKQNYLNEEITYKSLKILDDKESTDEFVHNVRIWLKDKMSLAAIKEGTGKLIGVLIMRIQEKNAFSRTFSKVKITYSPVYTKVMQFLNDIETPVNIFSAMKVRKYFKIYLIALLPRYRHRGIAKDLYKAAIAVSINANIPAMMGIFTTGRSQQIADDLGFVKLNEIYYIRYLENDEVVFWDTGLGNYGAALMAYRVPEVEEEPEEEILPARESTFDVGQEDEQET